MSDFVVGALVGAAMAVFVTEPFMNYVNNTVNITGARGKSACEAYTKAARNFDEFITANGEQVTVEVKKDNGTTLCKFKHAPKPPVSVPAP